MPAWMAFGHGNILSCPFHLSPFQAILLTSLGHTANCLKNVLRAFHNRTIQCNLYDKFYVDIRASLYALTKALGISSGKYSSQTVCHLSLLQI